MVIEIYTQKRYSSPTLVHIHFLNCCVVDTFISSLGSLFQGPHKDKGYRVCQEDIETIL